MRRIGLAVTLAVGLTLAPLVAETQQAVYRVGFVSPILSVPEPVQLHAFRQGLRELGYVEGKNVVIETRFGEGRNERLPELVTDLLRLNVDVLLAGSTPAALAAKRTTTTVPIVFAGVIDPVGPGVVVSLARPEGNITGVAVGIGGGGFTGKCLELLKEVAPGSSHMAMLVNPTHPLSGRLSREAQTAAQTLGLKLDIRDAANAKDLERALAAIGASQAQAIFVAPDPFLTASGGVIARFAAGKRLPTLHFSKQFAEAGGLMSYGGSLEDSYRRAAAYVDKILKGAKPGDLPVEQPTKFELVINLKTAKALGLTIPPLLLLQAAQVIE